MANFERMDIKKRWPVPNWIKLVLLGMMIFGFYLRSCWKEVQTNQVQISNIEAVDFTNASIDVQFTIANPNGVDLKKSILIKVILNSDAELASRLTSIEIPAKSKKNYLKILNRFAKPLNSLDEIKK